MSPIRATELPKASNLAAAVCAQRDEQHKMQMCPHLRMTLSKIVLASWQRDLNQGYLKRRAGGVGLALDFLQDRSMLKFGQVLPCVLETWSIWRMFRHQRKLQ